MNQLLISLVALLLSFGATAQSGPGKFKNEPNLSLEETEYNFGLIQQGEIVEHVFTFENTGTRPLIISDVLTTCECIEVEVPRTPITKGKAATIKVTFNSSEKMGLQNKPIILISNAANAEERIILKGNILPKEDDTR